MGNKSKNLTKILVVDDNLPVRDTIKGFLEDQKKEGLRLEVHTASSGEEALELLSSNPYKIVLTDYMMGGLTGQELIKKYYESFPNGIAKFIMMTGSSDMASKNEFEVYNTIIPILHKPIQPNALLFHVKKYLKSE